MVQQPFDPAPIRARLIEQAEKPISELLAAALEERDALARELGSVSERQARFKPPGGQGEDAWCIAEVARHIIQAEEGLAGRVQKLGGGLPAEGASVPGRLGGYETTPLAGLVDTLSRTRAALREAVDTIAGRERLDTTAAHVAFGDLNCRGWLALHALHVAAHTRQVEQVKAAPGYPA
jgi:hypothetical protein